MEIQIRLTIEKSVGVIFEAPRESVSNLKPDSRINPIFKFVFISSIPKILHREPNSFPYSSDMEFVVVDPGKSIAAYKC